MKIFLFILSFLFTTSVSAQIETMAFLNNGVDQVPENFGGIEELERIVDEQLIYPQSSLENKTEGTVSIRFICDSTGKIHSYKITNSVSSLIDKEAIRIFRMLLWRPAFKNGVAVNYEHYLEIEFNIKKFKKSLKRRNRKLSITDNNIMDTSLVIYDKFDKAASCSYGKDSLAKFIATELEYPQEAKIKNIEGTVKLSFIIEPNGTITNLNVENDLGGGCQEEAIRVMSETRWTPAMKNGLYVRSKMSYNIEFNLQSKFRDNSQGTQRVGGY